MLARFCLAFLLVGILAGCDSPPDEVETTPQPGFSAVPAPLTRDLPTLYPTLSPQPSPEPTDTRPPVPTPEDKNTPIAFDQPVVELRYAIPGLGLDRSINGSVAGHIEIKDHATGQSVIRQNQPGILIELQQTLPDITLEELPEGCDLCVWFEYDLPLADESDEGWLTDVQLLASIENYTAVTLGPHFPNNTILGIRRSATPYRVGHSVALTSDGSLWRWTATEVELSNPEAVDLDAIGITDALNDLELGDVPETNLAECDTGPGVETLRLQNDAEHIEILLSCPEITLPAALIPLYLQLDDWSSNLVEDEELLSPAPYLPMDAMVYLSRENDTSTLIRQDGTVLITDANEITYTTSISPTRLVSISLELNDNPLLLPGVESAVAGEMPNVLIVRGPLGLYEYVWDNEVAPPFADVIARLELLARQIINDVTLTMTPIPEQTLTVEATPAEAPENEATQTRTP